jgi:hypothetical protein
MADFDLTQTDAQVQSILNDGQNMQGAGAQTTLTTESVLLKDVNGNYHKILKSSFTEAIRDTLAGLLVNNDKGTTINQIAAIASGDFGSITPANLASVLGAAEFPVTLKFSGGEATSKYIVINLPAGYYPGRIDFCGFIPTFSAVISFSQATSSIETYGKVLTGDMAVQKAYKDKRHIVIEMNITNSFICGILMTSQKEGVTISYTKTYDVSGMTEITFS